MTLGVQWSDRLENLAEQMFASAGRPENPFALECVVVGSPVVEGWLKQYYLYDYARRSPRQRVLANWEFQPLHPFVNDWVAKAGGGIEIGRRNPAQHPYSKGVLAWRIWNELLREEIRAYCILREYIGDDLKAAGRKRWGLANKLAQMFDDYLNYRPEMLAEWERGRTPRGPDEWQGVLWRRLVEAEPETYLRQFSAAPANLAGCGIRQAFKRVSVFHVTAMPRAYLHFFTQLGRWMDVQMYVFNPSEAFWIEDPTVQQHMRALACSTESPEWMQPPHPLLSSFGRGTQAFLATLLDISGGQTHECSWGRDAQDCLLHQVQHDVRSKGGLQLNATESESIQVHACHSPMREVEVAKDLLLQWFASHPDAQPRDVQVLVAGLETYAPFIEAVFQVGEAGAPIPCVMSRRPGPGSGSVGAVFTRLLRLADSRMTAPEVMELLEVEPVRERYGLSTEDVAGLRALVDAAGIRWGRDQAAVDAALGVGVMSDTVTWRRGLDRLLAGMAIGRVAGDGMIRAGALGDLLVCDGVEGASAERLGKLGQFYEDLCATAAVLQGDRKVSRWAEEYGSVLERFFQATEDAFIEIGAIRKAVRALRDSAVQAGDPEIPAAVMAMAIESQIGSVVSQGNCTANAILFSPLQTMQVTPRRVILMMGLNEGSFPRSDDRTAFDWIGRNPRYGDRSLRYEDRLAFLEGVMAARDRLLITFTGRSVADNAPVPPSPVVTEFLQYLGGRAGCTVQKLHAFDPAYFRAGGPLVSYSGSNYDAAQVIAAGGPPRTGWKSRTGSVPAAAPVPGCPLPVTAGAAVSGDIQPVELRDLQDFFSNPARAFFTRILQVRIDNPLRGLLADCEVMGDDTSEDSRMLEAVLDHRVKGGRADENDRFALFLRERGLIPPGVFGFERTRSRIREMDEWLHRESKQAGVPILQLLQLIREAAAVRLSASTGAGSVCGNLPLVVCGGVELNVCFRYATTSARDAVRAWVGHVAGNAAGRKFATLVLGRKSEHVFKPFEQADTALANLSVLLELYRQGQVSVLPFAPETSQAYVKNLSSLDPGDNEARAEALEQAASKWAGWEHSESRDAYRVAAWGKEGPCGQAKFGEVALAFWKPLLDAWQTARAAAPGRKGARR